MSIYFDASQIGIEIPHIEYQSQYTVETIYQYIQSFGIDASQYCLTLDCQTMLSPQDTQSIGNLIQPNSGFYIVPIPIQPFFSIYINGQASMQCQLPNMQISDLLIYLQQNGFNLGSNISIDYYDSQSQPIAQNVDINQPLYTYIQGNSSLILNITSSQDVQQSGQIAQQIAQQNPIPAKVPSQNPSQNPLQQPKIGQLSPIPQQSAQNGQQNFQQQPYNNQQQQYIQQQTYGMQTSQVQQGSGKQESNQNIAAKQLLSQLILLKNFSILVDPNGEFVVYKFHFPTLVQGFLQKSKGKDLKQVKHFNWKDEGWVDFNKIKYCQFDDYGLAVMWEEGNISSVRIKQQ